MTNNSTITSLIIEDATPIRVLVVEDELHIRTSLVNYLEDVGFSVLSAESAEDALAILDSTPVDVIIVDVRLPKMDGNRLMIQVHQRRPNMHFLIYTGSTGYKLPGSIARLSVCLEDVFYKPLPDLGIIANAIQRKMKKGPSQNEKRFEDKGINH